MFIVWNAQNRVQQISAAYCWEESNKQLSRYVAYFEVFKSSIKFTFTLDVFRSLMLCGTQLCCLLKYLGRHLHAGLIGYKPSKRRRTGGHLEQPSMSNHSNSMSSSFRKALESLKDPVVPRRKRSSAEVYITRSQQGTFECQK